MTTVSTTVPERIALPMSARGRLGSEAVSLTAGDVYSMLRRRMALVIVLFFFFAILAAGGFLLWWYVFPGYRADALIECISNVPDTGLTFEQERLRQEEHERFVLSQAVMIKSPVILNEALKLTAVRGTDWYKSWPADKHLIELTGELTAAPVRGTNFLRVSMECRKRTDAAVIVNQVVSEWYREVKTRSAKMFASDPLDAALKDQESLNAGIEDKRRRLKSIAERLPAGARIDNSSNISSQQVQQYGDQVATLRLELALLEQYRAIYNNPEGLAVTAEDRQLVEQDPQVAELNRALFLLKQQRLSDDRVFGARHNELKALDSRIEAVEEELSKLIMQKYSETRSTNRQAANTAYTATQQALFLAQERLNEAEAAQKDQDILLFDYATIDKDITQDLEYKLKLDDYIRTLRRIQDKQTAVNVNIAQPAIDPLERGSPSLLMIPLGVFLALALALGIPLTMEILDKSVRTSQDVVRHLDVPMLGPVPDTDDEEVAIDQVETAVRDAPRSLIAEAFRRIRTGLQFSAPAERQRTVLIVSPQPEDGRTTVACNLAMAAAQGGRNVLLVDANFRRPSLHRLFDGVKAKGLSNILIADGTLTDYVVTTNTARLDVLGSGPVPPNPAELLGGEPCRAFLQEVVSRYDQVIIDSAPVLLASDAMVLATAVDGCILVVRAKENSRGVARRAAALLTGVGAHLFGAVLNAAQVTRGGYFREQLRSYYDYQQDAFEEPTKKK